MSQAPIRLVAIDVDGTLLDSSHRVPSAVETSLAGLQQRGIRIVLATARSPQLMESVLAQLSFVPLLICFSGGWIGDPRSQSANQQPLFERQLSLSAARKVINVALSYDLEPNVLYPYVWRVRRLTAEVKAESDITQTLPLVTSELLESRFGFGVCAHIVVQRGQVVEALRRIGMFGAQDLLPNPGPRLRPQEPPTRSDAPAEAPRARAIRQRPESTPVQIFSTTRP